MNEEPKSFWKKSFTGRTALVIWLALAAFTVMLGSFMGALANHSGSMSDWLLLAGIITGICLAACLLLIYLVWPLLRWLFWKHWRWALFGCACFATLIALFYAEENWRGKRDWEKFKQEWEAQGEHFDWASVVPSPVPDDQNFALTPVVASSYAAMLDKSGHEVIPQNTNVINRLKMNIYDTVDDTPANGYWAKGTKTDLNEWQRYYRVVATRTNLFQVPPQPQSPAQDVLLALSKYDSVIEELRQASRLPDSRFPLNYDSKNPTMILFFPHLEAMKPCVQVLRLRAIAELQNGQSEKALDDVELALQLTDRIRAEPFLISHLIRLAMLQIELQPIWEGLAEHQWSDRQLLNLDQALAGFDFLADYEFVMRGERAYGLAGIEYLRRSRDSTSSVTEGALGPKPHGTIQCVFSHLIVPDGFYYQNELTIARMFQQWTLPMVEIKNRTISPETVHRNMIAASTELNHFSFYNVFARLLFPAFGNMATKFAYAQSPVDLARVAIALERYRLAHGEYPETLDALTPQFIAKLPHDIINGQPLHYRRTSDGQFILYSVGWNETDDGGEVGLSKSGAVDNRKGDWVWRYPQK